MANEKNLIPNEKRTPSERRKNAQKAGIASGKARREKKTVQKLLKLILDSPCGDYKAFDKLASQLGLESTESVKKVFVLACTQKALKKADLNTVVTLCGLLGEEPQHGQTETPAIDELAKSLFQDDDA